MKRYDFDGFSLELDCPVEVGREAGHFWFPTIHPVKGRDLLCLAVTTDDKAQGKWPGVLSRSRDGGASWARARTIDSYGPNSLPLGQRRLLVMPYELWPVSPGDRRNARADGTVLSCPLKGALSAETAAVRFLDFPQDLADYHKGELCILTNGNILPIGDRLLFTTLYGRCVGDDRYTNFAVISEDGGFTWRFLSTVARPEGDADVAEGPDESNTVRLADGRLLCVYRVGSGLEYRKSYSADAGRTWTRPQVVEGAWSVEPQLVRLRNGLILLSGGRPGLLLWGCADGEGDRWEPVNLAEHHNALFPDSSLRYSDVFCQAKEPCEPAQSTSYTGMKAVGPNEVVVCYDRLGNGWAGAPGPWGQHDVVFCVRVRAVRRRR
jgi:hypothetical protein